MATTTVSLVHGRASDLQYSSSLPARLVSSKAADLLLGVASGARAGDASLEVAQTCASGLLVFASVAGTGGCVINGVTLTTDIDGMTDDEAAGTIAALINASVDPLVANHVTAESDGVDTVTLTAKHPGHVGNAVTLAASGTGVTASGARLTGGTSTTYTF